MHRAVWIAPILLLLIALAPLPYGYYQFLRIAICLAMAFLIWHEVRGHGVNVWVVCLTLVGIAFNPFLPIRLDREVWMALDLAAAAILGAHLYCRRRPAVTP